MVCDFIEEARNPAKHIPKAMFSACVVLLFAYSLVAFAAVKLVPAEQLTNTDIPHLALGKVIFGDVGRIIVLVLSITTTWVLLVLDLQQHHVYYMAWLITSNYHLFLKITFKMANSWFGIIVLATMITIAILVFKKECEWFVDACYYRGKLLFACIHNYPHRFNGIAKKYPNYPRLYKSPLFPFTSTIWNSWNDLCFYQ